MSLQLTGKLGRVEPQKGQFADRQTGEVVNYDNLWLHVLDEDTFEVHKVKVPVEKRHEVGQGDLGNVVTLAVRAASTRGEVVLHYLGRLAS